MDVIETLKAEHPCPLPTPPEGLSLIHDEVVIDTACITLMDSDAAESVWEDFLMDGHDHDHASGRLMINTGSVGTHMEFDTTCPVRMWSDDEGIHALEVELVPWEGDVDSGRRPDGWDDEDEEDFNWGLTETGEEGWSKPVVVPLVSDMSLLCDPAELESPAVGIVEVTWPAAGGAIHVSVLSGRGYRRLIRVVWTASV